MSPCLLAAGWVSPGALGRGWEWKPAPDPQIQTSTAASRPGGPWGPREGGCGRAPPPSRAWGPEWGVVQGGRGPRWEGETPGFSKDFGEGAQWRHGGGSTDTRVSGAPCVVAARVRPGTPSPRSWLLCARNPASIAPLKPGAAGAAFRECVCLGLRRSWEAGMATLGDLC